MKYIHLVMGVYLKFKLTYEHVFAIEYYSKMLLALKQYHIMRIMCIIKHGMSKFALNFQIFPNKFDRLDNSSIVETMTKLEVKNMDFLNQNSYTNSIERIEEDFTTFYHGGNIESSGIIEFQLEHVILHSS